MSAVGRMSCRLRSEQEGGNKNKKSVGHISIKGGKVTTKKQTLPRHHHSKVQRGGGSSWTGLLAEE